MKQKVLMSRTLGQLETEIIEKSDQIKDSENPLRDSILNSDGSYGGIPVQVDSVLGKLLTVKTPTDFVGALDQWISKGDSDCELVKTIRAGVIACFDDIGG